MAVYWNHACGKAANGGDMIQEEDVEYIRKNTDMLGTVLSVDSDDLAVYIQDLSELVLKMAAQIKEQQAKLTSLENRLWMAMNEG